MESPNMYRQNNYHGNRTPTEFKNLADAEDAVITLSNEIKTIEQQLQNRGRIDNFSNRFEYNNWKKKAQVAMTMKIKQLEYAKRWIAAQKNGTRRIPTEDMTQDIDLCMPSQVTSQSVIEKRPNADKVIDNLCGAILQMRAMKRRLYAFYKIANAAYDVLKETGVEDDFNEQHNLVYWLERAGYDVNIIEGTEDRGNWNNGNQHDYPHNHDHQDAFQEEDDYDYDNLDDPEEGSVGK
jgi:hypothetical protein